MILFEALVTVLLSGIATFLSIGLIALMLFGLLLLLGKPVFLFMIAVLFGGLFVMMNDTTDEGL